MGAGVQFAEGNEFKNILLWQVRLGIIDTMAPSSYKVYYFANRGRCEYIRYILALAGEEYEDIRVQAEDWPELKNSQ